MSLMVDIGIMRSTEPQPIAYRLVFRFILLSLFAVLACGACAGEPREPLCVHTLQGDVHQFQVEVARSDEQRRTGLMHRTTLAEDAGMLFDFEREQPINMWMKNTPLSLDMLFIGDDGRIVRIAKDTEPYSLKRIPSGRPARAVLEVRAGTSARLGIGVGDHIVHAMFGDRNCEAVSAASH
ncbi:MAG: DUF192 domain-containing protein [Gammaproteobacteria bacterium]|nr:DUF192 domain-containing protein [Gammaproteobacteria bacterium]